MALYTSRACPYEEEQESIYKLIPPVITPPVKPPLYRSKYDPLAPVTGSTFGGWTHKGSHANRASVDIFNCSGSTAAPSSPSKTPHSPTRTSKIGATFGAPPGSLKPDPRSPLKKYERSSTTQRLTAAGTEVLRSTKLREKVKPALPSANERPVMNVKTGKNFVVANAVEAILAPRGTRTVGYGHQTHNPAAVNGEEATNCPGGQMYLKKADYGKVPEYLKEVKKDVEREQDYINQLRRAEEAEECSRVQLLGEEERLKIVDGLKRRWEEVNRKYQMHSHIVKPDTLTKVERKERCEKELAELEAEIQRFEKKHVYIDTAM